MSFRPPFIPPALLAKFIEHYFPLQMVDADSVKEFDGYDDRNFYFSGDLIPSATNGEDYKQFVIKFVNSRDSENIEVLKGLSKLAQYLHVRDFKCPYPIPSASGCDSGIVVLKTSDFQPYCVNGATNENGVACSSSSSQSHSSGGSSTNGRVDKQFCVRVTVFVDGELFGHGKQPSYLLHDLGCYVGRMNKEMLNFSHFGIKERVLDEWDLKRLLTKRLVIPIAISDPEQAAILHGILDEFEKHVEPIIYDVPEITRGYIHSDINCLNILIKKGQDDKLFVNGLIDFSNAVYAPLLFELGIAMAYLMMRRENPAEYVKPFLDGFLSVVPLSEKELSLLFYVIIGRLSQSYLNGMYTHKMNPSNKYVLVETAPGWELIKLLLKEGKDKCYATWNISLHS